MYNGEVEDSSMKKSVILNISLDKTYQLCIIYMINLTTLGGYNS